MELTLPEWLTGLVFTTLLIFVRMGAAFVALPGLGSVSVPTRTRLLLALAFSVTIAPALAPVLPGPPAQPLALAALIVREVLIGLLIGTVAKIVLSTVETTGMIVSQQMSLANAMLFNPQLGTQSSLPGNLFGQISLVLLFVTDLHHLLLRAMVESYQLFPPMQAPMVGDMADLVTRTVADSFVVGLQIAAPFLVIMVLFFLGLGLLNRLMPQIQVFFVAVPLQMLIGFLMLIMLVAAMMGAWAEYFDQTVQSKLLP